MHMKPADPSSRRHPSRDGCNSLRHSSRRHPSSDGFNCLRSNSRRHPSSDGFNCLLLHSSRRHPSSDGCNRLRHSRGEDSAIHTCLRTSHPKLTRSNIIIITSLIAACLLPEVSAVANQNETKSTSPTWNSTGSDSMSNQTSNAPGAPSRRWSQFSRRGENPWYVGDNSSLSVLLPPNQPTTIEHGFRNASKKNSEKTAISAGMRSREQDDVSKLISIVVPFTCVIFVAGTLCVTYRLCHRYRCYNNKPGLTKCLTFCDRCMSTPYVFQLSDDQKDSNRTTSVSSDSGRLFRYSFNSVSASASRISTTPSPLANNTHRHARQNPTAQYLPVRHSSSSSSHSETSRPGPSPRLSSTSSWHSEISRPGPSPRLSSTSSSHSDVSPQSPRAFKPRLGAITSGRSSPDLTSASNPTSVRSTAVLQDSRRPQAKQPSTGQSQRPSFHLSRPPQRPSFHLSRQSHTAGYSRASGQSRGSIQSPPEPHRVPGAIYQRQDSAR